MRLDGIALPANCWPVVGSTTLVVIPLKSPVRHAGSAVLPVTTTCAASREPLLHTHAIHPGTHLSCVGSDTPGKQEIDAAILKRAALVLADSRAQCARLGELQHAAEELSHAVELGEFLESPRAVAPGAVTVADFTGLGVEDLYIAEYCWEKANS